MQIKIATTPSVRIANSYENKLVDWNDFIKDFKDKYATTDTVESYHAKYDKNSKKYAEQREYKLSHKNKRGAFVGGGYQSMNQEQG
ncbi:hypothetical protein ACQV2X_02070 [Facklamia sp. P12945]|uniref:hypothetical protein n=1 Tax=unclassified Facklamia TaxID=2622293 RepID=UPI003D17D802